MELTIIDGQRVAPFPSGHATCEMRGDPAIAKCGALKLHHWAHHGSKSKNTFKARTEWIGKGTDFDGDNFVIQFEKRV